MTSNGQSISENAFQNCIAWASKYLLEGKFTKAKQNALQSFVFSTAGIHVTTAFSKILDANESVSAAGNPKMHTDDRMKSFMIAFENTLKIIMGNDDESIFSRFAKPIWFRKEIFEYGDLKLTKKYSLEKSETLWRKFTDTSANVKTIILPIYQKIFNGPLPSGKQLEERLEELRN
jgi:hypothetical protein